MKNQFLAALFIAAALFCAPCTALACPVDMMKLYDTNRAVGLVDVTQVSVKNFKGTGSCLTVNYSTTKSVLRQLPATFAITNCSEDLSAANLTERIVDSKMRKKLGFESGASILIGVVIDGNDIKYIDADSAPFHERIDQLSDSERKTLLQDLSEEFSSCEQ